MFERNFLMDLLGIGHSKSNANTLMKKAGIQSRRPPHRAEQGKSTQWTRELTKIVCAANKDKRPALDRLYKQIVREDEEIAAEQKKESEGTESKAVAHERDSDVAGPTLPTEPDVAMAEVAQVPLTSEPVFEKNLQVMNAVRTAGGCCAYIHTGVSACESHVSGVILTR